MRNLLSQSSGTAKSEELWRTAPCSGYRYLIREASHGRAISQGEDHDLFLADISESYDESAVWLCVGDSGRLAFKNIRTGLYLAHNGWDKIVAANHKLKSFERFTIQPYPHGGYQLLSDYLGNSQAVVEENGVLYRRNLNVDSAWDFVAV